MVEHVGNWLYWVQWAQKVAVIVERHTKRITELISFEREPRRAFYNFLHDLKKNLNTNVTPKGRSPLEWIIDRYQIKTDSASGIVNNPNHWAIEHDNPCYILDLF